jgi:ATP-binding protein involved in chromosome partitioning
VAAARDRPVDQLDPRTRVIAVASRKGVGKSSITANLAAAFAATGRRVLDADIYGHSIPIPGSRRSRCSSTS